MARLDRLGQARELAQVAAVIGRDFSYALLRVVSRMDDAPLQAALDRLADADILLAQGTPPDADYRFKFRTRLMRICSRADAEFCTVGSARLYATNSPSALRLNRNCSRIISPKRA
jgi:hypothetical protein